VIQNAGFLNISRFDTRNNTTNTLYNSQKESVPEYLSRAASHPQNTSQTMIQIYPEKIYEKKQKRLHL